MTIDGRTTRRTLLRFAGATGTVSMLAACPSGTSEKTPGPTGPEHTGLIFATTERGVSVHDQRGNIVVPSTVVAVATPDWSRVITTRPDGTGTRVVMEDLVSRNVFWAHTVSFRVEPRIVSATGTQVASVTPGGAGIYGLHKPGGRERTTIVVLEQTGERARLDLPGNLEPEAFSPDGNRLYVRDFVPALKPLRYRVRVIDLLTGEMAPVLTRLLPPEQEETHVDRIERVYDPRQARQFAICSDEPDAVAFVHCLDLDQQWAQRINLPAPFGQQRPGVHTIALSASGDRLSVVHAPSASIVDIDPGQLTITRSSKFAPRGQLGKPNMLFAPSGRLIVHVDRTVFITDPHLEISTIGPARGVVLGGSNDIWVGHTQGAVHYDLATGKELGRITVPEMHVVKHVRATG